MAPNMVSDFPPITFALQEEELRPPPVPADAVQQSMWAPVVLAARPLGAGGPEIPLEGEHRVCGRGEGTLPGSKKQNLPKTVL